MGLDQLHYHQVIPEAIATIQALRQNPFLLVMGDQTTAVRWKQQLNRELAPLSIIMVDERYSSLEARDRYWQMYPSEGYFACCHAVCDSPKWMTLSHPPD